MYLISYRKIAPAVVPLTKSTLKKYQNVLFALMVRNIATDGWVLKDPSGNLSKPGAIIASPSYPEIDPDTDQNYVYNWTRDAATVAFELAVAPPPWDSTADCDDYVSFALICQTSGASIAHGCYSINGSPRAWSDQNDGPALQSLAVLALWPRLSPGAQTSGRTVISSNINFLLGAYNKPTTNLWEETYGKSFFAMSVILKCFEQVLAHNDGYSLGLDKGKLTSAIADLKNNLLLTFWDASNQRYRSILGANPNDRGVDLNVDTVMASVYGAIPCTDPKLLSTAAQVRDFFARTYLINAADAPRGIGPMIGRYPGDTYDGNTHDPHPHGQPWVPCTANFAELYYDLARQIKHAPRLLTDPLARPFFDQINISSTTAPNEAAHLLQDAGDKMLQALVFHSDHLEMSEQYDETTGYEKSVCDLSWSYAAFLSALRAR